MSSEIESTPAVRIPFVQPLQVGGEREALDVAMRQKRLAGDNAASRAAEQYLRAELETACALLTPSGTAALELAALLADLRPGDEVIMPSYTFSSTANAVVLRGAIPVFVDVRQDTLNIDETLIEAALSDRTRAIMVVHYAGVTCAMDPILDIARKARLLVIEDAAQALHSRYRGRPAGALGHMAAFSFHETKNVQCGEGGAFTCQSPELGRRAEIVREKGTNRAAFFRGEVDKYTWIDIGSSFLPSELSAAFLQIQLRASRQVTAQRRALWDRYDTSLADLRAAGGILAPQIPDDCEHNAHIYHLRFRSLEERTDVLSRLRRSGIQGTSHYVPLHSSPAGSKYGRTVGSMEQTDRAGSCLMRLPLWVGMTTDEVETVVEALHAALG